MAHLLQQIRLGQYPPGGKLPPERELAASLRVSRTSLREALSHLQTAGFVSIRRGRYGGTYVSDPPPAIDSRVTALPDRAEVEDVLTIRGIVEPAAARLAAEQQPTGESADHLWAAHLALRDVSVEQYRPLDSRLHLMIADLSGAPSVAKVVADVRSRVNTLLDCIPLLQPNLVHSCDQHEAIVRAILNGEAQQAHDLMVDHLDGSAALLRGFLGSST